MKLTRKEELLIKLLDPKQFLSKAESAELGPVNSNDLTISGDAFTDRMLGVTKLNQLLAKQEGAKQ